jgi:hypothetical protein
MQIRYVPLIANTHPKNLSIHQFYYLYGFERLGQGVVFPWNRFGVNYRIRSSELGKRLIRRRYNLVSDPGGSVGLGEVGTYTVRIGDQDVKFAIDASDHGHVVSQEAYDWCTLYFKGSMWEGRPYPAKVRPLVFGHNYLTTALFKRLKGYRSAARTDVDLVFINRILGGAEHNLRLFETLARTQCRKTLICIASGGEESAHIDRLRSAGVVVRPWLSQDRFWDEIARARVVFNRSGRRLCIPWKMSALLCMGACTVFDDRPRPNWPVPLEPEKHYIDCALKLPDNRDTNASLAGVDYSKISTTIEAALSTAHLIEDVSRTSADYFDRFAAPEQVAKYILEECAHEVST